MDSILIANTVALIGSLILITVLTVSYFKMRKEISDMKANHEIRINYYIRECERRYRHGSDRDI